VSAAPAISVLLPVYNGEAWIATAIESLLAQTFTRFELIVLDDGSTDATRERVRAFRDPRIELVAGARRGLVATLNAGLARAQAPLVARQDADDLSHPRRLELQVQHLEQHPEVALVGTEGRVLDEGKRPRRRVRLPREHGSIRWFQLFDNAFIHTSVLFRRDVVRDALGGYADVPHCEDFELWSRVAAIHPVGNLSRPLVFRRVHGQAMLRSLSETAADAAFRANVAIIERNLASTFGPGAFSAPEAALMGRLRVGVPAEQLADFRSLFARVVAEYRRRFPEAAGSPDFARTLALQHGLLARGLLQGSGAAALGPGFDAFRADARTALAMIWDWLGRGLTPA
jgi:glycosyltransferase involved in cell wall biosynthesis